MATQEPSWEDLLYSRDPVFLRKAADIADRLGRDALADALRFSADECEEYDADVAAPETHQEAA